MNDWLTSAMRGMIVAVLFTFGYLVLGYPVSPESASWIGIVGVTAAMQYHYGLADGRKQK